MTTPSRHTSGLALHGATVALTPARAVTSHLRKRYREKYHGRYRFPSLVFAFDLAVLGIAATLVAVNIYLFVNVPPPAPSLGLVFSSAPIKSAAPQALVAEVIARGSDSKGQISLRWNLPAGTEVLDAEPPINSLGEASLGALKAGEKASSRLVVRFFAPPGALRLGFQLTDGQQVMTGYENRRIEGSALTLEPLFDGGAALSDGRIPVRLSNQSTKRLDNITLTGFDRTTINELQPDQDEILFAKPGHVSALMRAFPIAERDLVSAPVDASARVSLRPSTGSTARLDAVVSSSGIVEVFHPGLAHPHTKSFNVPAGSTTINIPLDRPADETAWYAVASTVKGYGQVMESRVTTPFNVSAAIRYYASTGDQIGIGPLPPSVGEETRYWFQVAIGPTTKDLSDVVVRAHLAPSVSHTGRHSLVSGGGFSESEGDVIWKLAYLPASSEGATARFELALTPTSDMRGTSPLLIDSISAQAIEVVSGLQLKETVDGLDTALPEDDRAKGKGIVQ
ncbi:hypothetical protein K8R04_03610 [Candidatus Uhrbacteria bacterium]|nr:hypothetical protein [Candidatus Uhrbacteria bacterium]